MPSGVYERKPKSEQVGYDLKKLRKYPSPKYPLDSEGFAHCPECDFKHKLGSAVGRHRMKHRPGGYTPGHKSKRAPQPATQVTQAKEKENVNHEGQERVDPSVVCFVAGRITEVINSSALAAGCSAGELTEGVFGLLYAVPGRKPRRA